jgi:hypothetical protein
MTRTYLARAQVFFLFSSFFPLFFVMLGGLLFLVRIFSTFLASDAPPCFVITLLHYPVHAQLHSSTKSGHDFAPSKVENVITDRFY